MNNPIDSDIGFSAHPPPELRRFFRSRCAVPYTALSLLAPLPLLKPSAPMPYGGSQIARSKNRSGNRFMASMQSIR